MNLCCCWRLREGYGKLFVLAIAIILNALIASIHIISADNPTVVLQQTQQQQQQPCDRSRRVFTDSHGEISNGPIGSNYTQDSHCEWLIKAKNDSQYITLVFHSLSTECSYDYLFVYDGDTYKSPLLGSFSGKTHPQKVVATSGSMLILLYSDTNYVLDGFRAEYFVSNCPNDCTKQGKCVGHKCVCKGDWIAKDCSVHACPDNCGTSDDRGVCSKEHCRCSEKYSGKACSLHATNPKVNEWHYLASAYSGLTPRASHTAVYVEESDALYVYGGYDLNNVLGSLQIYRFNNSQWEDEWGISLRSRHFPAQVDNTLLKAVLHQHDGEFGLKSDASFFRTILLSISAEKNLNRRQRSPKRNSKVLTTNETFSQHQDISELLEELTEEAHILRPANRYGHAASAIQLDGGGFVVFGGKLENGSLSNEIWLFNVSAAQTEKQWSLRATNSTLRPPPLTRHTLTLAGDYLYVFGGSLKSGEFSSRLFRIQLTEADEEQWEEIYPMGGKVLDVRIVAHTTVYHEASNSLIVYGGIAASVARFSKISDRIFVFQLDERHWAEILYPRAANKDHYIPRERAFHTSTIIGNYMIVFGGYTHRHNKEEICYDNQMYLYHLGCHTWVKQDVLGAMSESQYPKQQGVFAHAAAIRNGHTLLLVGGYHGNVNADLLAYTLPPMFLVNKKDSTFEPEAVCVKHLKVSECLSDPDCGWCSADSVCYGRTIGANCTTNLQTTRCPGICPSLADCHSCLIHGQSSNRNQQTAKKHRTHSVADKLRLNQCQWCAQNARCHHKNDNFGVCGAGDDTPAEDKGWWGSNGVEVTAPKDCSRLDKRPGLTFLKYYSPVNWSMPDEVAIMNATTVDFITPSTNTLTEHTLHGDILARFLGFIRPPRSWRKAGERLHMCASYSKAALKIGSDIVSTTYTMSNLTTEKMVCTQVAWPKIVSMDEGSKIDFSLSSSDRFLIDLQANRSFESNGGWLPNRYYHYPSIISLKHNGSHEHAKSFTFEYLEPFSGGDCASYTNCLHCLSDAGCGWCELTNGCQSRVLDEEANCALSDNSTLGPTWSYLILNPTKCANCSNYVTCDECVAMSTCEWWTDDARCARIGRAPSAVREVGNCPMPCQQRSNCASCLETQGRCVWCEATEECFSFSVYTSEYQFGICREWFDQTILHTVTHDRDHALLHHAVVGSGIHNLNLNHNNRHSPPVQQCKSCEVHSNCSSCLQSLSCGWCFDRDNPIEGLCMHGDFNRSAHDCDTALAKISKTPVHPGETEWAYAQCPDVDECGLGLHDCHKEAKCTNTHGSYNCYCRRGFIGDGRSSCVRTCFDQCANGHCSGAPEYKCICDLGWTGESCSVSCGCNNHSTCSSGPGKCDLCHNWTEGESCERCRPGSFGNATSDKGCQPCECNGHGNQALGVCDTQTGECFCQDNTEGLQCEMCNKNYYGDPTNGGQCYFQCETRGMLKHIGREGIGSYQRHRTHWGPEARECLWIISPHTATGAALTDTMIHLEIQNDAFFNVTCGENAIYVYDGLPDLIGNTQQSQLLSVFCSEDTKYWMIEARSGHLTVHYKQSTANQGFNAVYTVSSCSAGSCYLPRKCNVHNQCVCEDGYSGINCELEKCPRNCSEDLKQGVCDRMYGRCLCNPDFGGRDCSVRLRYQKSIIITELFNSQAISESLDHLRKTLPRFGHSMVADKRGNLWMFAGYSLQHQALNDIRQFDTRNNTWMQVTVDSTPEAKMPQGRYFHGADIQHSKQNLYIYGGMAGMAVMSKNENNIGEATLNDFWKFSLVNQRWQEIVPVSLIQPPHLVGHSLTLVKDNDHDVLILIGGFSPQNGLSNLAYKFNLTTAEWSVLSTRGSAPIGIYGHSAVYHSSSQSIYVFGGYAFLDNDRTRISNKLYVYNYGQNLWNEVPPFHEVNRIEENLPRARFLHSAITTEKYMIIYGGRTVPQNSTDLLIAYVYKCNQWIRLTEKIDVVGEWPNPTYAQAMSHDPETGAIYIVNGWDGSSHSRVVRLNIPDDLCELWSSGKYLCRQYMGCSFCSIKSMQEQSSHCYSNERSYICEQGARFNVFFSGGEENRTLNYNNGAACDSTWISKRNCSAFDSCETCTAVWPNHGEKLSTCRWCSEGSSIGRCISAADSRCSPYNTLVESSDKCPSTLCTGDCQTCLDRGCHWSSTDNQRWSCSNATQLISHVEVNETSLCSLRCESFQNCSSCLAATGISDGGYSDCRWSTQLQACISPSYQPIWCVGGTCGLVLTPDEIGSCPEPCNAYTQCYNCLRHAHCGWCSKNNTEGDGVCTEGSLESPPSEYPAASTCDIIYQNQKNLSRIDPNDEFIWNYVKCPAENECINDHHNCDPESERCLDLPVGYECECADGYKRDMTHSTLSSLMGRKGTKTIDVTMDPSKKKCMPVCTQGCVRGKCVQPNVCQCDFGYVGSNCSIQCQCNGHSRCAGPDQLDVCSQCHNNTMGEQCEQCRPLFVGDPRNNGECVACIDYCHGHTDVCVDRDVDSNVRNMTKDELLAILPKGPVKDAVCLRCDNQTNGERCDGCISGHFRGAEDWRLPCRKCQCQGHGDTCDAVTGEKCNCGNNTESDITCTSGKGSAQQCWRVQCSKCRDSYTGNPVDGHQCYKQITVESKMCFDAKTFDECKKPAPLRAGQTVFFVVQPRFMNVDIRIIVDVTQGELNFYMSPQEDALVVLQEESSSVHEVYLDKKYAWFADQNSDLIDELNIDPRPWPPFANHGFDSNITLTHSRSIPGATHDCSPLNLNGLFVKDVRAKDLSTYVTLDKCNTMLRVHNLKNRLVLTLPQNIHNLSSTRFFIALKANSGPASYGLVFFRQDQLHIDLFVFFSVFFSCFFLFLAVCVVVWKAKQAADIRRARLRHVVEMLHMAKRPFATVQLAISHGGLNGSGNTTNTPTQLRRRPGRGYNAKHQTIRTLPDVRPVAVEPTADGCAAITTVFIRLPGKTKSPVSIALGTALVIMNSRQFPTNQRGACVRRSHAISAAHLPPIIAPLPDPI